jgi:hypothetical protein
MKNVSRLTLAVIAMFTVMAFTSINAIRFEKPIKIDIKKAELIPINSELELIEIELPADTHVDFLKAIGHKESGNNYSIVNSYGYMGRYQFGASTLKGLGYKVSKEEFLNSPKLQEEAMQALLEHNRKKLRRQIDKYCGQTVNGVYITESGILAAAHLAGQGNVKKFFRKGYEFKDGYGTTMTSYMEKFSGYQLDLN